MKKQMKYRRTVGLMFLVSLITKQESSPLGIGLFHDNHPFITSYTLIFLDYQQCSTVYTTSSFSYIFYKVQ